jgi:hypothetical protein
MIATQQAGFFYTTREVSPISIRTIPASELKYAITDLVDGLRETVNGGAPLGFMPPITRSQARDYWISVLSELQAGSRILLAAYAGDRIVGSGQIELSQRPNSPHRATIQRLFVAPSARGQGVGTALMAALEAVARENGRSLIMLNTRHGEAPETFYLSLGYKLVGVIPGWTIGPEGERYDHVEMYKELGGLKEDRGL